MNQYSPMGFNLIPPVVKNLLILNILTFVIQVVLEMQGNDISNILGLHYFASSEFKPIQLVSYMFLHGDLNHIFFNMFALWMFGSVLENFWGSKRFFIYYMATGIGAGIVQIIVTYVRIQGLIGDLPADALDILSKEGATVLNRGLNYTGVIGELNLLIHTSTIGASGAVFGLLMAFGMLFPNSYLYIFFAIPIKAKWFVLLYGAMELWFGVQNSSGDNVAHFAHLGGMIFGFLLIIIWRKKGTYL